MRRRRRRPCRTKSSTRCRRPRTVPWSHRCSSRWGRYGRRTSTSR
jgi:hypothetical protein